VDVRHQLGERLVRVHPLLDRDQRDALHQVLPGRKGDPDAASLVDPTSGDKAVEVGILVERAA